MYINTMHCSAATRVSPNNEGIFKKTEIFGISPLPKFFIGNPTIHQLIRYNP